MEKIIFLSSDILYFIFLVINNIYNLPKTFQDQFHSGSNEGTKIVKMMENGKCQPITGEKRYPSSLEWVIIGGMTSSMLLTLVVLPVVYTLAEQAKGFMKTHLQKSMD